MKNKIKKAIFWVSGAAVLAAPAIAGAQFSTPTGTNLPQGTVLQIVTNAMQWILAIVGILGVVGFAIAGIMYLTAAGNEEMISKAKKAMVMSIIGVIVALLGLVIMRAVQTWLGGSSTTF
jgi:uncharacterized membrane protein